MATKSKAIADIRKFTGFIAPDGTTHDTLKKATEYTRYLKVKLALADFALVSQETNVGVSQTDEGSAVVFTTDLPAFLLAHREDILAAFNQDVSLRAPKKPKVKAPAAATAAALISETEEAISAEEVEEVELV